MTVPAPAAARYREARCRVISRYWRLTLLAGLQALILLLATGCRPQRDDTQLHVDRTPRGKRYATAGMSFVLPPAWNPVQVSTTGYPVMVFAGDPNGDRYMRVRIAAWGGQPAANLKRAAASARRADRHLTVTSVFGQPAYAVREVDPQRVRPGWWNITEWIVAWDGKVAWITCATLGTSDSGWSPDVVRSVRLQE